jgi:hypothetical protein
MTGMFGRLACVGLVVGLHPSCYTEPQPDCGFICGPGGACPGNYTCNAADNRCHLDGTNVECNSLVASIQPPNGAMLVRHDATVSATFNTDVDNIGPATFEVLERNQGVAGTYSYDPATYTAVFTPAAPLPAGDFTVLLTAAITADDGRHLVPVTSHFATNPDTVPPTLISFSPADQEINVATDVPIVAVFDKDVGGLEQGVDDSHGFRLFDVDTDFPTTLEYDAATHTARLLHATPLPMNASMHASLDGITDLAGNRFHHAWYFFTTDTIPPTVLETTPRNGDTNIDVGSQIHVLFSESVKGVDATGFTVDHSVTGAVTVGRAGVTFTPDVPLPAATTITVTLSTAITDLAGNPLAAPVTFSFMTK